MGRLRKSKVNKSPFKLRRRRLVDGRESLYIYWRDGDGHQKVENLGLFLLPETSVKAKRENAKTLRQAENIIKEKTEALVTARAESFCKAPDSGMLLTEWIEEVKVRHQSRGARDMNGLYNCGVSVGRFRPGALLKVVDKQFLLDYLDWLRNEYKTKDNRRLSDRSIHSYSTTLRTILNEAVREELIASTPWRQLDVTERAKLPASKREFLTIDEVKRLICRWIRVI